MLFARESDIVDTLDNVSVDEFIQCVSSSEESDSDSDSDIDNRRI